MVRVARLGTNASSLEPCLPPKPLDCQPQGERGLLIAALDITEATGCLAACCKSVQEAGIAPGGGFPVSDHSSRTRVARNAAVVT
jgi:hypothetical protein